MKHDFLMVIAVILFLLYGATAAQAREWDKTEMALGAAALTLNVIDWKQTRHIAKEPETYHEKNVLLGSNPSPSNVDRHFLISTLVVGGLAHFIPEYRKEILSVFVVVQTVNTVRNYSIGLRVRF